jgi:proline iminopeptidase
MTRLDDVLFPVVPKPDREGRIDVDDGHTIHWEEIGPPDGIPLVVLHGGPGGRIKPYYRRLVDRSKFRAVFFDQRGCGASTPFGSLEHNTTWDLVRDIETLRTSLSIKQWMVLGGSWGSTLALAYGERHPQSCRGFVVSGIFLARAAEQEWTWHAVRAVYPEVWKELQDFLPVEERKDPRRHMIRRVLDPERSIHGPAAVMLSKYETQLLDVRPDADLIESIREDDGTIASSRIFAHYDRNDFFLEENQLLREIGAIADHPGAIVAGRFDMCTPPSGAFDLHQAWPGSRLTIAADAGHRWNDPPLATAIIGALDQIARASRL